MKEIKAYIRRSTVPEAVSRLEAAGAPGIFIVEIHPVGYGYEPNYFESHFEEDVIRRYSYLRVVKLEVVCRDSDLERLLTAIQRACRTGTPGDGVIFVAEISAAIRIRDGALNEEVLR
jgi:nitrogen regulatory protein PII